MKKYQNIVENALTKEGEYDRIRLVMRICVERVSVVGQGVITERNTVAESIP